VTESTERSTTVAPSPPDVTRPPRPALGPAIRDAILEGNSAVVTILAIVVAVVVGGLLIAFTDPTVLHNWGQFFSAPGAAVSSAWDSAFNAYRALFEGAVVAPSTVNAAFHGGSISAIFYPLSETLVRATPLILGGLSVALAFRAGLFNIGASAQLFCGALVAGVIGFDWNLPPFIHVVVAVIGGFAGGAILGWFVGWLKATTGAHEVIVTIMLNYIVLYFITYLLGTSFLIAPHSVNPVSPIVPGSARLPHIAGSNLRVEAGFPLAIACAYGVWWLLNRSTVGFEFRAVGANPEAARTAGMNVARTYILVMLIAGGLAGLMGANQILGTDFQLTNQTNGTYGVDAITVALLGRASPLGVVLAALLYGGLEAGGVQMATVTQIPEDIVTVIQALIVLFVAAPPLVRAMFRLRGARRGGEGGGILAKGWGG
jgi:ABC-type uncharacterized transport system permease subunit